jgi:hypothetical protein
VWISKGQVLLLKETTSNQEYWNGVAYRRGYEKGGGWAESCEDIPYNYRADAKDAYDNGVEDYAQFYDEDDKMIRDEDIKDHRNTVTFDVTPDWENLLLYFRGLANESEDIGTVMAIAIMQGDGGILCLSEYTVFYLNNGHWDKTAYVWEDLKPRMYISGEYTWTVTNYTFAKGE